MRERTGEKRGAGEKEVEKERETQIELTTRKEQGVEQRERGQRNRR